MSPLNIRSFKSLLKKVSRPMPAQEVYETYGSVRVEFEGDIYYLWDDEGRLILEDKYGSVESALDLYVNKVKGARYVAD